MEVTKMTNEELFASIKTLIVDQLGVDEDSITMDSSFVDDLNADSLDMVELVMAMEQEFDISIPDEVADYTVPVDLDIFLKNVDIIRLKNVFDDVMRRSREKLNEEAMRYGKIKREPVSMPDKLEYIKKYTKKHQ